MKGTTESAESKVKLAKKCLALIRSIAARGACSRNPEHIGWALQELSQVLFERTGSDERVFEPVPAGLLGGLEELYEELALVDSFSQSMTASAQTDAKAKEPDVHAGVHESNLARRLCDSAAQNPRCGK